jgi:hypothetical protein
MIPGSGSEALKQALYMRRKKLGRAGRNKTRKPQRWLYPWAVERHYAAAIRAWLKPMTDYVATYLKNNQEAILRGDSAALVRQDATPGGSYRRMLQSLYGWFTTYLPEITANGTRDAPPTVFMGLGKIADGVNDFNDAQWQKSAKAELGVEFPMYEDWWEGTKQNWQENNYDYFRSSAKNYINEINQLVEQAVRNGWSIPMLSAEIQKLDSKFTKGKANLIARDQVGKLNEQITQARMEQAGLTMYIWSTAQDERVRGNPAGHYPHAKPTHWAMEGLLCRWDDSTVYSDDKGKTWKPRPSGAVMLHPGQDIQCRCTALSYWDELVGEVDSVITKEEGYDNLTAQKQPEVEPEKKSGKASISTPKTTQKHEKETNIEAVNRELSDLRKRGKETGKERVSIMTADGTSLGSLNGAKDHVNLTGTFLKKLDKQPNNNVICIHNHPNSSSFSKDDLNILCLHPAIREMKVVGHNGKTYSMAVGRGSRPSYDDLVEYEKKIEKKLRQDILNRMVRREIPRSESLEMLYFSERNKAFAAKYGWEYKEDTLNGKK